MTITADTYTTEDIAELFPDLMHIQDSDLRDRVAAVWNEAITTGCGGKGWTFEELRAVKFTLLAGDIERLDGAVGRASRDPLRRLAGKVGARQISVGFDFQNKMMGPGSKEDSPCRSSRTDSHGSGRYDRIRTPPGSTRTCFAAGSPLWSRSR